MMLFDVGLRHDHSYKGHDEPLYAYINRTADPEMEQMRSTLEDWFLRYPKSPASNVKQFLRNFRDDNGYTHLSARFELMVHELLTQMGCTLSMSEGRHPDFLVIEPDGRKILIECVSVKDPSRNDDEPQPIISWGIIPQNKTVYNAMTRKGAYFEPLNLPYIIAVNVLDIFFHIDGPDKTLAGNQLAAWLYGKHTHVVSETMEWEGFKPPGLFIDENCQPRAQIVSGILTFQHFSPQYLEGSEINFFPHPAPAKLYNGVINNFQRFFYLEPVRMEFSRARKSISDYLSLKPPC
jgi:hypothetical protein